MGERGWCVNACVCAYVCVGVHLLLHLPLFPHLACFFTFANETICMAEEEEGSGDEGGRQWR